MNNIRLFETASQQEEYMNGGVAYPTVQYNKETDGVIVYATEPPKEITFTLGDYGIFQAIYGMTWRKWIESEYNVNNYTVIESYGILEVENGEYEGVWKCYYYKFVVDGECYENNNNSTFPVNGVDLDSVIESKTYTICEWLEGIGCGGGM